MSYNYLSRHLVMEDHDRFAKHMQENYNIENCAIYEETVEEKRHEPSLIEIGFDIQKDGKRYLVIKPFLENDQGELAISRYSWEVRTEGETIGNYLPSLEEVFQLIGMKKNS